MKAKMSVQQTVDHPPHYGGAGNPYEAIKVIHAWRLGFNLGNAMKYICRAGKTSKSTAIEDLKKARWYIFNMLIYGDPGQQFILVDHIPSEYTITHLDEIAANWKLNHSLRHVLGWIHSYVVEDEYSAPCCLKKMLLHLDYTIASYEEKK